MFSKRIYLKDNNYVYMTMYLKDTSDDNDMNHMVIIFPGGGYDHISPREGEPIAKMFNSFGMNAAVVNYEVHSPFPNALKTASSAVAYIRKHSEEFNICKDKIYVCGFSAGAHLAASLCTLWNKEPSIMYDNAINRPSGMILAYPVISGIHFSHKNSFENIGAVSKELITLNSAELNVDPQTPPAFIWHTFSDKCVPMENSLMIAEALRRNNVPFELHIFPKGCHGMSLASKATAVSDDMIDPHVSHWIHLAKEWICQQ